ncbi:hypothetical protein [Nocardia cyriacigeorgica]|uniref:hypothetical protein n=1 Tax=Nocardia cyriacigeorgica TaxID=135487 RepID=UPI001895421D|nr:hypothetical protein [Nocardia cyriacigeorgica]MBF6453414.1 hypothetical protein [Nocardia cyriacigeorgica]MBF6479028.1 hypothetical protein [Nocardia cyriacigeorgica]MBF6550583.1 hypothetical protein [Nocardia cyriacigeorgica]
MRAPLALLATCVLMSAGSASAAPVWGPLAPPNPHLGPLGTATMHGDAGSSDATPLAGPGTGKHAVTIYPLAAACPTLLQGNDGLVVALCTTVAGREPTVFLIDPQSPVGLPLASLTLVKGSLLGGVYAYLDNADRLVVVDGNRDLLRIGHGRTESGRWQLTVDASVPLAGSIPAGDNVTGLVPDWSGNVWFAAGGGVVGFVRPAGAVAAIALPGGEQVANSISAAPSGRVAVATTHALYELRASGSGPEVLWRAPYERGPARKPGQLSWGTGSTPTYFGPRTGAEYLTIVDNAEGRVRLLVFRTGSGELVCTRPVLTEDGAGSENSPIGIGRSVFVASTYGYPYPAVPEGAGPAVPPTAPFAGGLTRVDVDDNGCRTVWDSPVRSAAVPHLSTADGLVYTVSRIGLPTTTPLDGYALTVIDPETGGVLANSVLPPTIVGDPLQMSALITKSGKLLQGTVTGIVRVG